MSAPLDSPAAIHGALYNHLVLPAKLPQHRDLDQQIPLVEKTLCRRMAVAARIMSALPNNTDTCRETWETVRQTVVACQRLYQGGRIDKASLLRELQQLGPSGFIVLHIETQNAGLIIRRAQELVTSAWIFR